jgi:hypothetical protein
MLKRLIDIFDTMGLGLLCQDLGELEPLERKLALLARRTGQGGTGYYRVVLATERTDEASGLELALHLAAQARAALECLFVLGDGQPRAPSPPLLERLWRAGTDFGVCIRQGELLATAVEYTRRRDDVLCVVCCGEDLTVRLERFRNGLAWRDRAGLPAFVLPRGAGLVS